MHAATLEQHHCAYCDAPLAASAPAPGSAATRPVTPRYCCYGCRVLGESGARPLPLAGQQTGLWFRIGLGAAIAMQAMMLDAALKLGGPAGAARLWLHAILILSAAGSFTLLGPPLLRSVAARFPAVGVELFFLCGMLSAFAVSVISTARGTNDTYYQLVPALLTVFTVSRSLGAQSRARALAETRKLHGAFDDCLLLQSDGTVLPKHAAEIQAGDHVRIPAGQGVPIDGEIVSGESFVLETPLTGEPFPVVRRPGDLIRAGSYCEDGELVVRATRNGNARALDDLLRLAVSAREAPSRLQEQADRLTQWLLPAVLAAASGTFLFWGMRADWITGLLHGLSVLLVACPCALGLATPLALWNGLSMLASRGLVARNADALEALAGLEYLVFDKTGTLTEPECSLIDLVAEENSCGRLRVLQMLGVLEAASRHPIASAFKRATASAGNMVLTHSRTIPARGVEARLRTPAGDVSVRVGSREFMPELRDESRLRSRLRSAAGDLLVYVAIDGRMAAIAAVRERLRASARDLFPALQRLGIQPLIMTGDSTERAAAAGLADTAAGLTPADKAVRVSALRQAGHGVGFVGDGINDAPALSAASVGIALNHGASLAQATAGAVLFGGDLAVLPWAIEICRRVRDSIRSNLMFAAAYNLVGISLAAAGRLHPVAAALLMVLSSFIVSWRALRAARAIPCCAQATVDTRPSRRDPAVTAKPQANTEPAAATRRSNGGCSRLRSWLGVFAGFKALFDPRHAGVLIALQGPFLVYLGGLSTGTGMLVVPACAILGWITARISRYPSSARGGGDGWRGFWGMTVAMLGIGNWGMLLGWWVDAGFAPVSPAALCPHCTGMAAAGFSFPWMYAGMLLLGMPPMLSGNSATARVRSGLLSGTGMVLGMVCGARIVLKWLPENPDWRFLLFLGGMVVGMLAGMHLFCEMNRWTSTFRLRRILHLS